MHEAVEDFIQSYLEGERGAVAQVDGWILAAAKPFHRRIRDEWDDAVQETRLEVFQALGRGDFRGEAQLKTYVFRVVSHTCLDRLRRRDRWKWTELAESQGEPRGSERRIAVREVPLETADLVARVLQQVPEECRSLWSMLVAGLSYREMGRAVDASEGALRVRVLRCRKKALEVRDRLVGAATGGNESGVPSARV